MKIMKIFLDLDDVLVDFRGAAAQLHNRQPPKPSELPTVWDLPSVWGITVEQFWRPIHDAGEQFWLELQPLPWMVDLVDLCHRFVSREDLYIVTSPSECPSSYVGKIKWIKRYFGDDFNQFFLTPHKEMLAQRDRILIDDRSINVHNFRQEGGSAFLFPSVANHNYMMLTDMDLALDDLVIQLESLETFLERNDAHKS
jgi:5'(3')-deoxyribonucleotidase